jgi:hypothetical protein
VDGASHEWFEEKPFADWQGKGYAGVGKARPSLKINGAA